MTDSNENILGEKRSPEEVFSQGVDSLRKSYEAGFTSLETKDQLLVNAELATLMLTLEADGKIILSDELKDKATKDLDAMLASIKVRDAEQVGDTILSVLGAMRKMNKT